MKKIGLALGGGAVLGAAHIGVLKALEEFNIKVSYVSGTSIGAFVGCLYAFGKSWEEINEIAKDLRWLDISSLSLSKFGLLSNEKLGNLIIEHIGEQQIENAQIPFSAVCTNAVNGQKETITKGPVHTAVRASTCIPGIFKPITFMDKMLIDGGIVENVPILTVKDMGAEYIIAVDLNSKYKYQTPENIIDVMINSFHFVLQKAVDLQSEEADLFIKPNLEDFNMSDMDQIKALIDKGYEEAKRIIADL